VRLRPEFRLLTSVPGIGQTLATLIMLEVGTIERFAAVGNFASYARCVDSARISNGKKKGQGNVKNGNAYLAWAFVEAANFAHRYCAEARRFYERKKARTNGSSPPRRWRTSWRAPAITCSRRTSPST
jgi:Transposase IS116/IS110/IS902 family.